MLGTFSWAVGTRLVSSSSVAERNRSPLPALAWEPQHGPGCQVLGAVIAAREPLPNAAGGDLEERALSWLC